MKKLIILIMMAIPAMMVYSLEISKESSEQWLNILNIKKEFNDAILQNKDPSKIENIVKLYDSKLKAAFVSQIKFSMNQEKTYYENILKIIEFQIREAIIDESTLDIEFTVYAIVDAVIDLTENIQTKNVIIFNYDNQKYGFDDIIFANHEMMPIHRSWLNLYPEYLAAGQRGEIMLRMNILLRDLLICKSVYFD